MTAIREGFEFPETYTKIKGYNKSWSLHEDLYYFPDSEDYVMNQYQKEGIATCDRWYALPKAEVIEWLNNNAVTDNINFCFDYEKNN